MKSKKQTRQNFCSTDLEYLFVIGYFDRCVNEVKKRLLLLVAVQQLLDTCAQHVAKHVLLKQQVRAACTRVPTPGLGHR